MNYTQYLILELGRTCNLGKLHPACPNRSRERFAHINRGRTLDNHTIYAAVQRMYREFGFRGLVGWHYYGEPLIQQERMFQLMDHIRDEVPEARFVLWTNGTLLPEDCSRFRAFEQIHVTDYEVPDQPVNLAALSRAVPDAQIHRWPLDGRLTAKRQFCRRPCLRMFTEFIIDHHGNVHLCCYDWKGLASPGNIFSERLDTLVARWQRTRAAIAGRAMTREAPDICLYCSMRPCLPLPSRFVPEVADDAYKCREEIVKKQADERSRTPGRNARPAVVFVSYKIPTQRLDEHFRWNDSLYRHSNTRVYVVTDRPYDVPDYAECLVYSESMPVFSLTKTRNFGIRTAIKRSHDLITCSDVDIAFAPEAWERGLAVDDLSAAMPVYLMADNFPERRFKHIRAENATGTVTMTAANWKHLEYDERCTGYGCDDGILRSDIGHAGLRIDRQGVAYHIAHQSGSPQEEFQGRRDQWNRESGFNPENFTGNAPWQRERLER